jgi:hypothetical protein
MHLEHGDLSNGCGEEREAEEREVISTVKGKVR